MSARRFTALTAAVLAAAALTGGTAATASAAARPATIQGHGDGTGATLQAAETAAIRQLRTDYSGCGLAGIVGDGQLSDGTWWAEATATCKAVL